MYFATFIILPFLILNTNIESKFKLYKRIIFQMKLLSNSSDTIPGTSKIFDNSKVIL